MATRSVLVRWAVILACLCGCVGADAQGCVPAQVASELEKLAACSLQRPVLSSPGASLLLLAPAGAGAFCRITANQVLAGDNIALSLAADSAPLEGGCLELHKNNMDRTELIAHVASTGKLTWQLRTDAGTALIRVLPANLPAFQPLSNGHVEHVFGLHDKQIQVPIGEYVSVNYGSARISSVSPANIPDLKYNGLDLELPAEQQSRFPTLQVGLANEYGQTTEFTLSLVRQEAYSDSPTLRSLKIELAHVRKLEADERFMRARAAEDGRLDTNDAAALAALYQRARASLPACSDGCGELSRAQLATVALLRADVDYRAFLLERRLTFWGGFRTLKPSTPHRELIKLQALLARFKAAYGSMEAWTFRAQDTNGRLQELSAQKQYVQGQIKAEDLTAEVKGIDIGRWQRVKANNIAAKRSVEQEMANVSERMEKLAQQQEALGKQATSLTMNLAASAAGIPVDVVAGVAEGDLKKAVLSYVGSELADPSSILSTELQQFGDVLVEANGAMANLRDTYKTIEEYQRNVDLVAVAIREPSMERFLKVGELAYSKLSESQVRELNALIESQKPVQAWLQASYHKVAAVRGEIESYRAALKAVTKEMNNLPKTVHAEARSFLRQELKKAGGEGEKAVRETTAHLLDGIKELRLSGRSAEAALANALSVYPSYIADTNTALWYALKARYPGISDEQILVQLSSAVSETLSKSAQDREAWMKKTGLGFLADGKFVIEVSGQRRVFDVESDIIRLSARIDASRVAVGVDDKLDALVSSLEDNLPSERLMSYVANAASAEGASAFISKYVAKDKAARMWNNLKATPPDLKAEVDRGVRYAMAASLAAPAVPRPAVPVVPSGASIPASSAQEQMQNQMVGMALNAAFPGAGTVLQLGQAFASMDANRELNEQLAKQSAQLISAYQELVRSSEDADFGEAVSLKEYARANALVEAAKAQLDQYNGAIDSILDTTRDADARLRLYRPYFFYLAEMLRQQFDLFDRSLAMWSGATDSRGFFAARIATDPSLARLALDSEIHLFDWLNRDREATKTDPFLLYVHWQQLGVLADSYCADHGCKPGDNVLGQIGTTERVGVLETLATPGTKEQFRRWKDSMNAPFVFRITLDPSQRLVPSQHLNVRNLDWNVIPVTRTGSIAGTHVQVTHLGHSQIPFESQAGSGTVVALRDESMLAAKFTPSNRKARFDASALAERFQAERDLASLQPLRALEGWGLYASYELTVANSNAVRAVEDFEVEIAYIYTDPGNVTSERGFLAANAPTGTVTCSGQAERSESACRSIYYFAKGSCDVPPRPSSNRWLQPDAGLEYLYATAPSNVNAPMKLCKGSVQLPLVKRAVERQRASVQCNWATALSDVRAQDRDGAKADLKCQEIAQ